MPTDAEFFAYAQEVMAKVQSDGDPETFGGPGYPITFAQGDVTPINLGSQTDHNGDTFSLLSEPGQSLTPEGNQWYGGVAENGQTLWDGYTVALRFLHGDVWAEEAKSGGWQDLTANGGAGNGPRQGDPGTDDGSGGGSPTPPPPPPPDNGGGTPPPTDSGFITPGVGSFNDAAGNIYAIDANTNADENGSPIPGGYGTAQMGLVNSVVYAQDVGTGSWYTWDQSMWSSSAAPTSSGSGSPPPPSPPDGGGTPPPSGGDLITPGIGSFNDAAGNSYSIDLATNAVENGASMAGGYGTAAMTFFSGSVYGQDVGTGSWYTWDQSMWTPSGSPQ